jgi:hypothetical protein
VEQTRRSGCLRKCGEQGSNVWMYIGGHGEHRTDAAPARNPETNTSPTNGTYSVAKIFIYFRK